MKPVDIWSLKRTDDDEDGARSLLYRDGVPTGTIVPGCVLEAQFSAASSTCLFITHDIPYEERLDIVLLTEPAAIIDRASLWGAFTTGNFRDARVAESDGVTFNFFGGHRWRVRLLPRSSFRLPMPGWEPPGVHRPFGFNRRFIVEKA
jgi:hypothetical protein